ncbi:hypothetical protein [Lactococcus lactis]|uniref:hypothetical protein n=1 Tax=Lactococcus lactis TaxID=1358 RepID=UPI00071D0E70|nr:hypothetical protein [Lactococcus lactis]
MSDPCYKIMACPYCGHSSKQPTAWIDDARCSGCGKWMVHNENNLFEEELNNLEKEYRARRKGIYKKYETKPVFKMERIK